MNLKTHDGQPDRLLRWMNGLADPSRLRLLCLLERHELGVSDLCVIVQMPQSTVSRHLKVLAAEGWVTARRDGTTNRYHTRLEELDPAQRDLWRLARRQAQGWATLEQDQVRLGACLADRRADARAFFADAAARWDQTRARMYGSAFEHAAALALLPAGWTVADLGCGTAALSADLARTVRRVIAVDNSQAMLDAAARRCADLPNLDLRLGDLEALPIDDGACDAALCVLVLTYLPDPAAALAEMARILRPGGVAVVVDLMRHDRDDFRRQMGQQRMGFEAGELSAMFSGAGFSGTAVQPLDPAPEAQGPALLLARAPRKPTPRKLSPA